MDYLDIRNKFAEVSGRYDLINMATYEDNGADFFINAGQRYLDRQLAAGKMIARYPVIMEAGDILAVTTGIRSLKEVWASNSDGEKWQLDPMPIEKLRWEYPEDSATLDRGTPLYYAIAKLRPIPDAGVDTTSMTDVEDLIVDGTHYTYRGVVIMPPPDETLTVTLWGLFYSPELSATLSEEVWTQTKSYWSEVHPDMLIQAAMMKVSSFYGDPTRVKEHKEGVIEDIRGLDFDFVDEELVGTLEMGE